MELRKNDARYLGHVERWFNVLLPKMAPYLYHRGGPILMTQVCDKSLLRTDCLQQGMAHSAHFNFRIPLSVRVCAISTHSLRGGTSDHGNGTGCFMH